MNGNDATDFIVEINRLTRLSELENDKIVKFGEKFGGKFKSEKMHQLRKFLDFLKKIEYRFKQNPNDFKKQEVLIMKIYLKNSENKAKNKKVWEELSNVMDKAFEKIKNEKEGYEDFKKLVLIWEAIIAYHKEQGGTNE